jgi:hypothetical protein
MRALGLIVPIFFVIQFLLLLAAMLSALLFADPPA